MAHTRTVIRQLLTRVVVVAVILYAASWVANKPVMADTTVTTSSTIASVGLTILYGSAVIGILFILSSISTLSLIATEAAQKKS